MAKHVDIVIPEEQREGTELELGPWLKAVGDWVEKDEPVVELVTDKAVVEIPSPASGTLDAILVETESALSFDMVLGRIRVDEVTSQAETRVQRSEHQATSDAEAPSPSSRPAAVDPGRPAPHPAVVRFAELHGIDLTGLEGTGHLGRITSGDVQDAVGAESRVAASPPVRSARPSPPAGESRIVRHDPMRRRIAQTMAESLRRAPHVTAAFECDLSSVLAHRARHKEGMEREGIHLTLSAYFLRATVEAVREVPEVNSRWLDEGLQIFESIHVGVGTALEDRGLVVPVVYDVQDLDLAGCAAHLTRLIDKARSGRLRPEDMRGSTITVSNHGVLGSLWASPVIIQPPESAILGIGKLEKRPRVMSDGDDDRLEIRPMTTVTLTIDHRGLDAFHTNRFLTRFCRTLEAWPE
ncbi:MAG: dihydrolipoamide acetyltransferase family protein [Myxococcota bacterium]